MMNKKVISIVLGIMCLALTAGICIQIRTVTNSNTTVSQNQEENNLRAQVLKYKERYDNKLIEIERIDTELEKARSKAIENNQELENAEEEIKQGNRMIGLTDVTGPGVIIKLSDSKLDPTTVLNPQGLIIHDIDVLSIINELKNAGAEAIAINNQRVVSTSGIICGGNIININGERVGAPFEIKAIGLPETLANLKRPNGYLDYMKRDGIEADLDKYNEVSIPKYAGVINYKYLKNKE